MILESIKTVFKVFKTNKMRTFLTMVGMIIGIFSITIIFCISDSTKQIMNSTLSIFNFDAIILEYYPENYITEEFISSDLEDYIKTNQINYRKQTNFYAEEIYALLETENENYYPPTFLGIDENYFESYEDIDFNDYLKYGRLFTKKDIVNNMEYAIIRDDIAVKIFGRLNVVGEILEIDNYEFEIIGVLGENDTESVGIYLPYNLVKDQLNYDSIQYQIYADTKNKENVKNDIKNILSEFLSKEEYYMYSENLEEYMSSFNSMIDVIELVFIGIASLSIIVGGIGIMNIMLVSVSERIKETGIRMALGAKNRNIILQFLIEGIMITILSGIIGILLASLATNIINIFMSNQEYDFELIINFITMVKIIIFCGIIGIVFGIYPAIKAGKLDPVEALKYE